MDVGPQPPIRVLLVDDHRLLTDALAGLLSREPDIEVCGVAATVAAARAAARELMDVGADGLHAAGRH